MGGLLSVPASDERLTVLGVGLHLRNMWRHLEWFKYAATWRERPTPRTEKEMTVLIKVIKLVPSHRL